MLRGIVTLGLLAGAGWYAYRKLLGGAASPAVAQDPWAEQPQSSEAGGIGARASQSAQQIAAKAREAAATAATKVRSAVPGNQGKATDQTQANGDPTTGTVPPEARAAAMAGMPAVQAPATIPEPR